MGMQGDFFQLLKEQGYQFGNPVAAAAGMEVPTATTILALKYRDGVLVAGDRRATAGNMVMYDRTDKVLEIDRHSVMAIAGVPATAYEMVRVLEHSFKYYRRTQLQELSFEGKLRAVSKLLKENVPAALAGTGAVVPVFAGYDQEQESAKIYFYDILGAEFEAVEYAVSGSGSPTIRGHPALCEHLGPAAPGNPPGGAGHDPGAPVALQCGGIRFGHGRREPGAESLSGGETHQGVRCADHSGRRLETIA
jgi:proteasome beta subunit